MDQYNIENPMLIDDCQLYRPRVFCICDCCGEEIHYGEKYYEVNDDAIHVDCKYEYLFSDRMDRQFTIRTAGE
jgi:hypothetical protein